MAEFKFRGRPSSVTPAFAHDECTSCRHLVSLRICVGAIDQTLYGAVAELVYKLWLTEAHSSSGGFSEGP